MNVPMLVGARVAAGRRGRHADAGEPGDHPGLVRAGGPRPGDRHVVRARRRGRPPSGRSSAAGSSTPRRGAGSSCSTCRSASPSSPSPCATCPSRATRTPPVGSTCPAPSSARWPSPGSPSGSARSRGRWRSSASRCSSRSCSSSAAPRSRSCRWRCSRRASFSGTNVVTLLLYGALGVVFFLLGLVLQGPLGYTPLQAGAATVPITLAMLFLSSRAGALAERIGPRIPMTVGPLLVAAAMLLLTAHRAATARTSTDVLPGHRRVRARPVAHRRPADGHRPRRRRRRARRRRLRRQQRRGPHRPAAGRRRGPASSPASRRATTVAADDLIDGFHTVMRVAAGDRRRRRRRRRGSRCAARRRRVEQPPTWHCAAGGPPPAVEPVGGRRAEGVGIPPLDDDGRIVGVPSVAVGDQGAALLALYDDAVGEVYGYLLARCRNRTVAEDVTSEVFMGAVDAVAAGRVDDGHDGLADRHRPPQARRPLAARRARAAPAHRRRRRAGDGRPRTTRGTPSSTCSPPATRSSSSAPTTARR